MGFRNSPPEPVWPSQEGGGRNLESQRKAPRTSWSFPTNRESSSGGLVLHLTSLHRNSDRWFLNKNRPRSGRFKVTAVRRIPQVASEAAAWDAERLRQRGRSPVSPEPPRTRSCRRPCWGSAGGSWGCAPTPTSATLSYPPPRRSRTATQEGRVGVGRWTDRQRGGRTAAARRGRRQSRGWGLTQAAAGGGRAGSPELAHSTSRALAAKGDIFFLYFLRMFFLPPPLSPTSHTLRQLSRVAGGGDWGGERQPRGVALINPPARRAWRESDCRSLAVREGVSACPFLASNPTVAFFDSWIRSIISTLYYRVLQDSCYVPASIAVWIPLLNSVTCWPFAQGQFYQTVFFSNKFRCCFQIEVSPIQLLKKFGFSLRNYLVFT